MQIVPVAAGTRLDQLEAQTGLSEAVLRELFPAHRLQGGAFRSGFDLVVPPEYGLARAATSTEAPPCAEDSSVGVRSRTRQVPSRLEASKGALREVGTSARVHAATWSRLAQTARSVFDRPGLPEGPQIERADRIVRTLLAGFEARTALTGRLEAATADAPGAAAAERREAEQHVTRLGPSLRGALETTFNALPRMLRARTPERYFPRYRAMIETGDVDGLRELFAGMQHEAIDRRAAEARHGEAVRGAIADIGTVRRGWHEAIAQPVRMDRHPRPPKPDAAVVRGCLAAARAAFDAVDSVVSPAKATLATLVEPGSEGLAKHLSEVIERAEAAPLVDLRDLVVRARSALGIHDVGDSQALKTAGRAELESTLDAVCTRAENLAQAQADFGERVQAGLQDLEQAYSAALRTIEHGEDPVRVWAAARAMPEVLAAPIRAHAGLLESLAATPGGDRLHARLQDRQVQLQTYGPRQALMAAAKRLPSLYALTFCDRLSESQIGQHVQANEIDALDAYQAQLARTATDLAEARKTHGPTASALTEDAQAAAARWRSALPAGPDGLTVEAARSAWSSLGQAKTELAALEARAEALEARVAPLGHAGTPLKVEASNARAEARRGLEGALRSAPRRLVDAFELPLSLLPSESKLGDAARAGDYAQVDEIVSGILTAAEALAELRQAHGDEIEAVVSGLKAGRLELQAARSARHPGRLRAALETVEGLAARREALLDGPLSEPVAQRLRGPVYRAEPKFDLRSARATLDALS